VTASSAHDALDGWLATLDDFGIDREALHSLDASGPELLPYATLTHARVAGHSILRIVGAVYEWQDAPLVFLVNADQVQGETDIHQLRRLLAMRGDAPYLGVVAPGRLDVYAIALDRKTPAKVRTTVNRSDAAARDLFATLANRRPRAGRTKQGWISNVVLNLLTHAIDCLIGLDIYHDDAISLVGRALFARFLGDRDLLPPHMSAPQIAAALFDNADRARATCTWLDATFNGDLLPLSDALFDRLPTEVYVILGNIMRRADGAQLFLGWDERWDQLDFAHIPVGVLSQAYELYLRSHAPKKQRLEGGYYTPRPIADLLVRASFRALERTGSSAVARILDPAAGAGVFLLTAFREIVAAQWKADGKRPDTARLRQILYNQITGFDINEAALRFAALALYLISIELDPDPQPVDKLAFENLRGRVLHLVEGEHDTPGAKLGSLGPQVGDAHRARYDVVLGNPPWATGTKLPDWHLVREAVATIASERMGVTTKPRLPNEVLDLPFVWRAMEWAKPGGQIALALHARLLFQQGDGMAEARQTLFQALDVTSVINGVDLRQTKVWPEISAPFCLLLAANRRPEAGAGFRLISPRLEAGLNAAGVMRIDAQSAEIIATQQMLETPEILKILYRGSRADLSLIDRIRTRGHPTIESFWRKAFGLSDRGIMAGAGRGYQTLKPSSRVREKGDGLPGADAKYLRGLPDVTADSLDDLLIDISKLSTFQHDRVHDPRDRKLFEAPIVIVHQSPPAERRRIRVAVADERVAYNESFYGYCPGKGQDGTAFVRYLALVIGSQFALWFTLMTSGKFGFEREVIEKAAFDRMPLPDFYALSTAERRAAAHLFEDVVQGGRTWEDVDHWVATLYGLGPSDLQTIADTLAYNLPFSDIKIAAQALPDKETQERFRAKLRDDLEPWAQRFGTQVCVSAIETRATSPWLGLQLHTGAATSMVPEADWEALLDLADATAATELMLESKSGGLLIGRLAQNRFWTETQARLLAQQIIWSRLDVLKAPARA